MAICFRICYFTPPFKCCMEKSRNPRTSYIAPTKEAVLQKLRHYCAYAERCHAEIVSKLYDLGVWKKDQDEIVITLIQENYLNEERYAIAFAGGHFRSKKWGRNRIKSALKLKGISEYCIKRAMKEINEQEYAQTLQRLFDEKWQRLGGTTNRFVKMKKTQDYLQQKGYELHLIQSLFNTF